MAISASLNPTNVSGVAVGAARTEVGADEGGGTGGVDGGGSATATASAGGTGVAIPSGKDAVCTGGTAVVGGGGFTFGTGVAPRLAAAVRRASGIAALDGAVALGQPASNGIAVKTKPSAGKRRGRPALATLRRMPVAVMRSNLSEQRGSEG